MKKILAVDDEEAILRYLDRSLRDKGYDVRTTSNPLEIQRILASDPPDLIILDVIMPEQDGIALFNDLKSANRVLPVLFVTGHHKAFDISNSSMMNTWNVYFGDGNVDILYKPFRVEELYAKIELLIGPPDDSA